MKTRHDQLYIDNPTPSSEVVRRYRAVLYEDDHDASLALVHYRGGEEEFLLGCEYCRSTDAGDRATGANILGQLGWGEQHFREESIQILLPLLDDQDPLVINCAAGALGYRVATSAIPGLLRHVPHSSSLVRFGVALGLSAFEDPGAVEGLIILASDKDRDVRDWAVFGLGTQLDADSEEVRDTLRHALDDLDDEIRGEALVGLARRNDPVVVSALIEEWKRDRIGRLSIEAAVHAADSRLLPYLEEFNEMIDLEDDPYWAGWLARAVAACQPKQNRVPGGS